MSNNEDKILIIAGPTASGKTSLAVQLAYKLKSTILSADSRQVYKGMDIGTGKDLSEYHYRGKDIPYKLIDIASPNNIYTLYHYQKDCYNEINNLFNSNSIPIIAGGTGLYIEAVLKKYRLANVPENIIFRENLQRYSKEELLSKLREEDIVEYRNCDKSSKKRIVRSLEIADYKLSSPITYSSDNAPNFSPLILITRWDRDKLKARITTRLNQRLNNENMIGEVEKLIDSGISIERLNQLGMEYREIGQYLHNLISYDEMYEKLKTAIFRLSKRQSTWFRGMEKRGFRTHYIDNANYEQASSIIESNWNL